jgi:hypothetical protein
VHTFELLDKVDQILGSLYANSSNVSSLDIKDKVDELSKLLNKVRKSILAEINYNRQDQS